MKHTASIETRQELIRTMKGALGEIAGYIEDESITDIEYNSSSEHVFTDGAGGRKKSGFTYSPDKARTFLNTVASYHGHDINEDNPSLAVRLPKELAHCRLQAYVPPITEGVSIVLRKPGNIYSMDDYVTSEIKELIKEALTGRKNILFCGSTGAGKTSFLNSVIAELKKLCPNDRLNILEDTHEVQCDFANHEYLFTVKDRKGQELVSMADNVKHSLRNNPDRIIVGEVRDRQAAHGVLTAWDTGHEGGFCTFHAGSALKGYSRFYRLAGLDWNNPLDQMFAAGAIDLILFLSKIDGQRAVREVVNINYDYATDKPVFDTVYSTLNNN